MGKVYRKECSRKNIHKENISSSRESVINDAKEFFVKIRAKKKQQNKKQPPWCNTRGVIRGVGKKKKKKNPNNFRFESGRKAERDAKKNVQTTGTGSETRPPTERI